MSIDDLWDFTTAELNELGISDTRMRGKKREMEKVREVYKAALENFIDRDFTTTDVANIMRKNFVCLQTQTVYHLLEKDVKSGVLCKIKRRRIPVVSYKYKEKHNE